MRVYQAAKTSSGTQELTTISQTKKIKRYWQVKEKIKAAKTYKIIANYSKVARLFPGSTPTQIRRWTREYAAGKYKDALTSRTVIGTGRKAFYPSLEQRLVVWIRKQRSLGHGVSRISIVLKAKALAKTAEMLEIYPSLVTFQASLNWLHNFMKRHRFSIRRKTSISQHLPEDLVDKVKSFHQFVITCRKSFNPDLAQIGNMDETPIWFDMPADTTVAEKGK